MFFSCADPLKVRAGDILNVEILCPILVYTSYHALGVFLCCNQNKEKVNIILFYENSFRLV